VNFIVGEADKVRGSEGTSDFALAVTTMSITR
jgi:hypothetical protein